MGRKQKRGKAGNAAQYLTRNQAIKKLQLRLSEFRRLCILKGVHPREPKKKVAGANKTYYHVKDINWLAHEPLIATFRKIKVHERRVRKARAKQHESLARRLLANKPGYKLDSLVKERYPSFIDALRDLDDPLTLVHLFATLPAEQALGISPALTDRCRRLVLEWNAWVARTHSLRKVFVSVKGFYYQAEVAGCSVTWLVPHQLAQVLPPDVDYTVMITFLEFYCTLLQFVLFKLYHNLGLRYPPVADRRLEAAAAGLAGIMKDIAGLQQDQQQEQQQQQQQQQQLETAAANGGSSKPQAATVVPDVVQRLGTLGKKIQELQQQQQQSGEQLQGSDDDALPEIDSGAEDEETDDEGDEALEEDSDGAAAAAAAGDEDSEEEVDSEAEDEEAGEEEEAEGKQAAGADVQQPQQLTSALRHPSGDEPGAAAGAAAAGGGLGEVDADDDAGVCSVLLQGRVFFLAREVPREPLLFMIRAFGGAAGWEGEGSPFKESDDVITHQIVDRPTQGHRFLSRSYVQPQWLFDSLNHRVLMPAELYAPGHAPPPHLSPFVDNEAEGYTPEFAVKIKQLQEAARAARRAAAGQATEAAFLQDGEQQQHQQLGTTAVAPAADSETAAAAAATAVYQKELAKEIHAAGSQSHLDGHDSDTEAVESEGEGEDDDRTANITQQQQQQYREADEEAAMADIMMTRKNRKLYARINRAIEGKAEKVAALEQRKRRLSAATAADNSTSGQQQQQQRSNSKKKKKN